MKSLAFELRDTVSSFITTRLPAIATSKTTAQENGASDAGSQTTADFSDEILISRVTNNDTEAFALLFRRYARVVRAVALRSCGTLRKPRIFFRTFVLIHRLCRTFDSSKASAQFWILQMTYRRAISRRRYLNSRHFYTQVELDDQTAQFAESQSVHVDDAVDSILAELDLQKMFGTLSGDQQKTLRLHFIEGYTLDEIAKMLGQTKGNVRHHSFRGLDRLRKQIFAGKLPGARGV